MYLNELKKGQLARVLSIELEDEVKNKLGLLGLFVGSSIAFERNAPLRDPQEFVVSGNFIAIRKMETRHIHIELMEANNE